MIREILRRLHMLLLFVAILPVGVWVMDHLTTQGGEELAAQPTGARPAHPGRPRAFVLLVDSLRYRLAYDAAVMPYLARMPGVRARVLSSRDAVTVSAIREMFSGRERFLAFGFVRDFLSGRESVESLFTQLRREGRPAAVYPPYAFIQFGDDLPPRELGPDVANRDQDRQDAWIREALGEFNAGSYELCVGHIVYSDRVAHDVGVHGAAYAATYRRVDDLIRELDGAVAAEDTLVIAGDHGHTDSGRHALGLDVPTFALYRGAAFRSRADLGTIPIAAHRYLLGWALQLPLAADYQGSRHPEALASAAPPPEYAAALSLDEARARARRAAFSRLPYLLLAAALGLGAGLWLGLVLEWWRKPRPAAVAAWLSLALSAAMPLHHLFGAAALLAGAVALAAEYRAGARRPALFAACAAPLACALHLWGSALTELRDAVHEASWEDVERVAFVIIVLTAAIAWRAGAARAGWFALALVGVCAYPTVYRYGAMPGLVTMWLAWLAAVLVDLRPRPTVDGRLGARWSAAAPLGLALGVALLLNPFAFGDASNFEHESWRPWLWNLMPLTHDAWVEATLLVKLLLFARWRVPHVVKPLGIWAAWEVHRVHWGQWHPSPGEYLAMMAALAAAGALLPRWFDGRLGLGQEAGRELRRVVWLWALYLAYYYTIRIPNDHYMWADCFLLALALSARLAHRHGDVRARSAHYAILMLLAVIVAGWVTVAWTLHLYEWSVLYDFFDPALVEEHALWFVPIINGRYLVPVVMARMVLAEGFGHEVPFPRRAIWIGAAVKTASLMFLLTGIGHAISDSAVYREGLQEGAALMVFVVGLL